MTESILEELEQTREKMIKSALENGFGNVNTIQLSEKVDQLLNAYHRKNYPENPTYNLNLIKN
ncbi:aspartyl-phosphate phosphatase Spo0E family protein [Paenisporosarcina sp. OV554]|uniref:aspartyl-phosphate phosphatase Spo0E family protein n=1 Tax=Paenisporosarcina sp. OV554 TaxID=2135694 RepID=UPI000D39BCB2|nr:aspartyl-phosphate phosphatase Spo0E family protein [Paenisporosarcina sp. OV554]PUB17989.1 Spo0E like sporulation regulatory protein [Paenisporosarcina sp. OV554]